jgi:hypothetical protein
VIGTAGNLPDRDVVGAKARDAEGLLSLHLDAKTKLPVLVRSPREDLCVKVVVQSLNVHYCFLLIAHGVSTSSARCSTRCVRLSSNRGPKMAFVSRRATLVPSMARPVVFVVTRSQSVGLLVKLSLVVGSFNGRCGNRPFEFTVVVCFLVC